MCRIELRLLMLLLCHDIELLASTTEARPRVSTRLSRGFLCGILSGLSKGFKDKSGLNT